VRKRAPGSRIAASRGTCRIFARM